MGHSLRILFEKMRVERGASCMPKRGGVFNRGHESVLA